MPDLMIVRRIGFEPGHRERWMAHTDGLITATRAEPGCRRFEILLDPSAANEVVVLEQFQDEAALTAHEATVHFVEFLMSTQDCRRRGGSVEMFEATVLDRSEPTRRRSEKP